MSITILNRYVEIIYVFGILEIRLFYNNEIWNRKLWLTPGQKNNRLFYCFWLYESESEWPYRDNKIIVNELQQLFFQTSLRPYLIEGRLTDITHDFIIRLLYYLLCSYTSRMWMSRYLKFKGCVGVEKVSFFSGGQYCVVIIFSKNKKYIFESLYADDDNIIILKCCLHYLYDDASIGEDEEAL